MIDRRRFLNCGLGTAVSLSPALGLAQSSWPDKPVKIIVLFGAGGASDTLTRMLAERLQVRLGQPFVIENRTGAGGNIGMQAVASAPADGYTVASATIGTLSINQFLYSRLGYDPVKDFAPVSSFWENCNVFAVSSDHPAKTLQEFRTWAAARPQGVTFSSSGVGTTPHLAGELFGHRAGIKTVHVPFRSSATTEVMSGTIDFAIDNVASWTPFVKAGRARALAVTLPDRWPVLPDVPTMAEAGIPDFVFTSWGALAFPGATPPAIVERLSKAVQEVSREPGMQERFLGAGARFVTGSPQETAAMAARERVKWKEVVRLSGAKLD
jgi:tripartite-type tricarboxylate transporter receptor subunit TctC